MPRAKAEPKHNPEKFRRHLNQAMFHLGLAQGQLGLLKGRESQIMESDLQTASTSLQYVLASSKEINPPIENMAGQAASDE